MKVKLLIFDFDGTLVDTAPDICDAINAFLIRKGKTPLHYDEILPEIGMGLTALFENTFPNVNKEPHQMQAMVNEFIEIYDQMHLQKSKLFQGASEFLDSWKGQIAILSNKKEKYIHSLLKHLDIAQLPWVDIVGGDTFTEKKPSRMPFDHILKKADCLPEHALMIGDGEPDILGGINSNIRTVAVSFGYSSVEKLKGLGAWQTIDTFQELHQLAES